MIKLYFIARLISEVSRLLSGIEIHPGALIGRNLVIDHGIGLVIGETAIIEDDCFLFHGVTLGGVKKDVGGRRHPHLHNGVSVGAGAKILGSVTIGAGAKIGAGAVVLKDCPQGATMVGVPGQIKI